MKNKVLLLLSVLFSFTAYAQNSIVTQLNFKQFESYLRKDTSHTYVLNFWATWCKPCLAEMPHFVNWYKSRDTTTNKLIFVNLDFNKDVPTVLIPFWKKRKYGIPCVHLTDTNPDTWINLVDASWSGAIPATAFYRNGKFRTFKEAELTPADLDSLLLVSKQR